ncbi:MAG TPA: 3-dehydroquinate synthase [Flavobacteriaceae bacterium]|nr:3-dehydroquinate synthase [Flavobacteriaceae bacterium]HBR54551.1 3-dehydroquinate synthase [Flavobacteriaceae bacterium]
MKVIKKKRGTIYFGDGCWDALNNTISILKPSRIFILADTNTTLHCVPVLLKLVSTSISIQHINLPAGEQFKTIDTCQKVWKQLSEQGADRNSLLINIGGGVVTDLGGFVACTFKRGIEFINIPTSLLAIVDAAVGGKNGVDLGHLKNQIGIIKDPLAVFVDSSFLETLPTNQMTSGYAEMLKHGLIASETYWETLKTFKPDRPELIEDAIWESIEIKNDVVVADPTEKGLRKTLNYGHTLGHAIESYCLESNDIKTLLHGEAIAIGLILANYISSELTGFPKTKLSETTAHILRHFPKEKFSKADIEQTIELLKFDKKNVDGVVNFVLLKNFGSHEIDKQVPNSLIYKAFEYYKNFKKII